MAKRLDTKFQIDLIVGIVLAALVLAGLVALINTGATTESFSFLAMGWLVGVLVPPGVAVLYIWMRHPDVSRNFLWLYAFLTFLMLVVAMAVAL